MATNAQLIDFMASGLRKTDGSINAAGTVEFYTADQTYTTGKDVYDDYTVSGANNQTTVTLDANGTALWYGDGLYDVKVKDSDGNLVMTIDNFHCIKSANTTTWVTYEATDTVDLGTISPTPDLVAVNKAGAVTLTLPLASSTGGKTLHIHVVNAAPGITTINRAGSETINGATSTSIPATQYASKTLVADDTDATGTGRWFDAEAGNRVLVITGGITDSDATAWTTGGVATASLDFGTVSVGDVIWIGVSANVVAGAATTRTNLLMGKTGGSTATLTRIGGGGFSWDLQDDITAAGFASYAFSTIAIVTGAGSLEVVVTGKAWTGNALTSTVLMDGCFLVAA